MSLCSITTVWHAFSAKIELCSGICAAERNPDFAAEAQEALSQAPYKGKRLVVYCGMGGTLKVSCLHTPAQTQELVRVSLRQLAVSHGLSSCDGFVSTSGGVQLALDVAGRREDTKSRHL